MPETRNQTRVMVIAEPGLTQQQMTTAITSQADFQLVEVLDTLEKAMQHIRTAQPEQCVIDHHLNKQPTLDAIDELASQFPEVAFAAILPAGELLLAQQVMLAGARAFIFQPFTQVNLLSTLRRVRDLEARRRVFQAVATPGAADHARPLQVIAVYSPRGGVGCSTVATSLALALLEETNRRVLLLEGKLFFGHLGLMLNLRAQNTLADLIPHANVLEEAIVRDVVIQHVSDLHVLLGPTSLEVAQGIRPEALFSVVDGLRRMYDFIVIDVGSTLNENAVTLMDAAERVLLITVPELAALHDASRFIHLSRSLAYPAGKIMTVLNRAGVPGGVKTGDIETVLHHELFAHIPDDEANVLRSLNRGIPLILKYRRSPASQAIQRLAKALVQASAGEQAPATGVAGPIPAKAKPEMRLVQSRAS